MIVKLFLWYLLYAIVHDTCIHIEDQKIMCLIYKYALSKHTLGFSTLNQFQTAQYIYFAIKRKFELNYPRRTHNRHFKKIDPDMTTMINGMLHVPIYAFHLCLLSSLSNMLFFVGISHFVSRGGFTNV